MPDSNRFAVMLIVESSDPRLSGEALGAWLNKPTARSVAKVRRAVLDRLPDDVQRLVAVFSVEHAKLLLQLHEAIGNEIVAEERAEGRDVALPFVRPPPDYIPPSRE